MYLTQDKTLIAKERFTVKLIKRTANGGNISEMFIVFCPTTCEILILQKMNGFLSVKEQLLCGSFFKYIHHTSEKSASEITCI